VKYLSEIKNNSSKRYIIRSIRKYGIENFKFEIIENAASELKLNNTRFR